MILIGSIIVFTGCSASQQQSSNEPSATTSPAAQETEMTEITPPSESPKVSYTHLVSTETAYYLSGPQQGRPSEGNLSAGIKVAMSTDTMGSYVFVESENGIKAWVHADALKPIE